MEKRHGAADQQDMRTDMDYYDAKNKKTWCEIRTAVALCPWGVLGLLVVEWLG